MYRASRLLCRLLLMLVLAGSCTACLMPNAVTELPKVDPPAVPNTSPPAELPIPTRMPNSTNGSATRLPPVPPAALEATPFPISMTTALTLSEASPLDVQISGERLSAANARLERARLSWLPNMNMGVDYFRHDGQIQDIVGQVFTTSRTSFLVGGGPQMVLSTSDAWYAPLAARQLSRANQADVQRVRNDVTYSVAASYFTVQQARGELAGATDSLRRAEDLVRRAEKLAPDLTPEVEVSRAKAEAARRRLSVESAFEKWRLASAELTRILRLQPGTLVEPCEDPALTISLIDPLTSVDDLIAIGLTNRPELASHQAVVQAALVKVNQEKHRAWTPTIGMRGTSSNTPGLMAGSFGGGINDSLGRFGPRMSVDMQAIWEFQNLGFGNQALVREKQAEHRQAMLEMMRIKDTVAAEIVSAHAQLTHSLRRMRAAEESITHSVATAEKNLEGLGQTKRVGEQLVLVFRPQEAVAAVVALDQAYRDYYTAIGDHNRAQFRLYRAMGHPAQALCSTVPKPNQPIHVNSVIVPPAAAKTGTVQPVSAVDRIEPDPPVAPTPLKMPKPINYTKSEKANQKESKLVEKFVPATAPSPAHPPLTKPITVSVMPPK